MKRIAIVIVALIVSHCGGDSLVSPEEIAGTYALLEVKVDTGTARAQVYPHRESDADSPTGFIELKANRTYRFFARFPDPQIRVWETQGLFGVATNSEITFSTTGRNFSGSFFNQRTRIAVTEFSGCSQVLTRLCFRGKRLPMPITLDLKFGAHATCLKALCKIIGNTI